MIRLFFFCATVFLFVVEVLMDRKEKHELNLNFFQNDYIMIPERMDVARYDKNYMDRFEIVTFKYNRSTTAFNVTMNFKFDVSKFEMIVQGYKFLSNEYRYFPMRFQANFCKAEKSNVVGLGTSSCGNFHGCPLSQGRTYNMCNWVPDASKFPPHMPNGRYMLEMQAFYLSIEVAGLRAYFTVTRPEV